MARLPPGENPPRPRRTIPTAGVVPVRNVARIEAYAFNRARDRFERGPHCEVRDEPFTREGRTCGDVRLPIATLSPDELARVTSLLTASEARLAEMKKGKHIVKRAVVRCGFDPHHALALFDANDQLLGRIVVCFSCHEWLVLPASEATGGGEHAVMTPDETTELRAILDAHDLGASLFEDEKVREAYAYDNARYGWRDQLTALGVARRKARLARSSSGVATTRRLVDLSREDRALLCGWLADDVRPSLARTGASHGFECERGESWSVDYGEAACAERPLTCTAAVADVEACLRDFLAPDHLCGPAPKTCDGLLGCLPGITRHRSAELDSARSASRVR